MTQLAEPVDPFGEVNVFPQSDGSLLIKATILMEVEIEGARTGLALDASSSMTKLYGFKTGPFPSALPNLIEPVAREMAKYLTRFSRDGRVTLVYWTCHPNGAVEEIGDFDHQGAESASFGGPKKHALGRATILLPVVRHFLEKAFANAPWAICVIVTDGKFDDLSEVKEYCFQYAHEIASGKRKAFKFVIIGFGQEVDETQMRELDDMFEGSGLVDPNGEEIDLWDHKMAESMKDMKQIFSEVVTRNAVVASWGRVRDQRGNVVIEYSDGLPALLEFTLPRGSTAFSVEHPDGSVTQDISEAIHP